MLCDHTATFGGLKMFVICGVDNDALERRADTEGGSFSLSHEDVEPLAIVPMKNSNGELLLQSYLECIEKHGNPSRMVTDGGSDILRSARLLSEHQEREGENITRHTYDISHRIARIIQAALEHSERWQSFETMVKNARQYCKDKARHLSPPNLSHGPDRWMNLCGILKWYSDLVGRVENRGDRKVSPRFGHTERVLEMGRATYRKCGKLFKALGSICGREHATEEAYDEALRKKCPNMPKGMKDYLDEKKDLNKTYLGEVMTGWQEHREIHEEVDGMLKFTNEIQKLLKNEGLSKRTMVACRQTHREANLKGMGKSVGKKVMDALGTMVEDLKENERIVATSDVLESLNGTWKMLIGGSPTPALAGNALLMPAIMGKLDTIEVKHALETVSVADVEAWKTRTFGVTYFQERRAKCIEIAS